MNAAIEELHFKGATEPTESTEGGDLEMASTVHGVTAHFRLPRHLAVIALAELLCVLAPHSALAAEMATGTLGERSLPVQA